MLLEWYVDLTEITINYSLYNVTCHFFPLPFPLPFFAALPVTLAPPLAALLPFPSTGSSIQLSSSASPAAAVLVWAIP